MAKYRNKLQIIAEILEIVRAGAKKTHIMYGANLSYKLVCKYLNDVVECGLARIDGADSYVVAPRGVRFLEKFDDYRKLREHVKNELSAVEKEKTLLEQMYSPTAAGGSGRRTSASRLTRRG